MLLWLTREQAIQIAQHATENSPNEVCGLIWGSGIHIEEIVPVPNISNDPENHFYMDPSELLTIFKRMESAGSSLLAIYHSHPKGDPIPSQTDIREFQYPGTISLIVGLKYHVPKFKAWLIHNQAQIDTVELVINDNQPALPPDRQLSNVQKAVIVLSMLIAVIIMLSISISLLPPAPIITPAR